MKKLIMGIITLTLLSGCNFILGPGGTERGSTGTLTLNFGGSGGGSPSALAISHGSQLLPEMLDALNYQVAFAGPGDETLNHALAAGETLSVSLALGSWRIDVSAYYQGGTLIEEGALIGTGSTTVPIKPGANSARINMNMAGPLYEIIIPPMTGGTVAANFSYAFAGTPITLTVLPLHAGAILKPESLMVDENVQDPLENACTFTMPLADVTVTAEFLNGWRYVKETASGTGDGSSWANASDDLQKMMDLAAEAKDYGVPEALVRVAAGTYYPEWDLMDLVGNNTYTPGSRDSAFFLRAGVEVRGSYPAGGGDDTSRNPEARSTILSGDIGTLGDDADNTYHVVFGMAEDGGLPPMGESTVLDGLTITGGNANVNGDLTSQGGGIFLGGASPALTNVTITGNKAITGGGLALFESSPVLTNGTITGNSASGSGGGGGMYNYDNSSPVLNNVTISNNTSTGNGGGMYNYDNSSPVLTDVTISNNTSTSGSGGGMYNENSSSPVLTNVVISGNTSSWSGGGMENFENCSPVLTNVIISGNSASTSSYGGGMLNVRSSPVLTNVLIAGNVAGAGGGMSNQEGSPILTNVTISGNSGGGIFNNTPYPEILISNSIIWGNTAGTAPGIRGNGATVTYSIVQDSTDTSNGNVADPGAGSTNSPFVDLGWQDPASVTMPNSEGDYRLKSGSPAINVGNSDLYPDTLIKWGALFASPTDNPITAAIYNAYVLPALAKDLGGNPRLNGTIDMGAYERE